MKIRHAVLTDTHIIWISENARQLAWARIPGPIQHINDLWEIGHEMSITHFWILPDSTVDKMGHSFISERDHWKKFVPGDDFKHKPPHSVVWKKGFAPGTFEITVNYPASSTGFAWNVQGYKDILVTIDYLQQVLGIENIEYSAHHCGKEVLKKLYSGTKRLSSYIAKSDADFEKLPFKQAALDLKFFHPLMPEMEGMHYHLFDKNSAHPSAASSMMTGTGNPIHLWDDNIVPQRPGIYRVSFHVGSSLFDGVHLPLIIESEWVTLDILKFAIKKGYSVQIHEAHVFEHAYNVFGEWARDLWAGRQALKDKQRFPYDQARIIAQGEMKNILKSTISNQKQNGNWRTDMIGMARVAILANLEKFAEEGPLPLYVYMDGIGYVSPKSDPARIAPGILERHDKLGGYKHVYSFQLTGEMIEYCAKYSQKAHAQGSVGIHSYLKKIAIKKGLIDE